MGISENDLHQYVPYYLTRPQKEGILKALKEDFPEKLNYYTSFHHVDVLQGDCWTSLEVVDVENLKKKEIKGVLLSNSCDISRDNRRDIPPKIVFAPIIALSKYQELLVKTGTVSTEQIVEKIKAIKEQKVTSIFYLPSCKEMEESIVLLDDVHNVPTSSFYSKSERKKLFTLSQVGFYMFIFKLSIHFCRMHEDVIRDSH
jgi:hypothetical protein